MSVITRKVATVCAPGQLASQCPTKEEKIPDLGLFMQTNGLKLFMADDQEISDELVLMVLG